MQSYSLCLNCASEALMWLTALGEYFTLGILLWMMDDEFAQRGILNAWLRTEAAFVLHVLFWPAFVYYDLFELSKLAGSYLYFTGVIALRNFKRRRFAK